MKVKSEIFGAVLTLSAIGLAIMASPLFWLSPASVVVDLESCRPAWLRLLRSLMTLAILIITAAQGWIVLAALYSIAWLSSWTKRQIPKIPEPGDRDQTYNQNLK